MSAKVKRRDDFKFHECIGEGSYSSVFKASVIESGDLVAIKVVSKKLLMKENKVKYAKMEKAILNKLNSPFVVKLLYTFQDNSSLYYVMELAPNGDFLTYIRRYISSFDVASSKFYIAEIIAAIEHLQHKKVIHRDLKPENILLDDRYHIKLGDFGTAKDLDLAAKLEASANNNNTNDDNSADSESQSAKKKTSFVGTAEYCPPELLSDRNVSFKSDIWAIGCILYQLLCGFPPFKGATDYLTFIKIQQLEYEFPSGFPDAARELIQSILVLEPTERPSIEDIKSHHFFKDFDWKDLNTRAPPKLEPKAGAQDDFIPDTHSDVDFEFSHIRKVDDEEAVERLLNWERGEGSLESLNLTDKATDTATPPNATSNSSNSSLNWKTEQIQTFLNDGELLIRYANLQRKQTFKSSKSYTVVLTNRRVLFLEPPFTNKSTKKTDMSIYREFTISLVELEYKDSMTFTLISSGINSNTSSNSNMASQPSENSLKSKSYTLVDEELCAARQWVDGFINVKQQNK